MFKLKGGSRCLPKSSALLHVIHLCEIVVGKIDYGARH